MVLIDFIYDKRHDGGGIFIIQATNADMLSVIVERHAFAMDSMRSMPHPSTYPPSSRAPLRPFLNGQELSPPLDDPLLSLERVVFGVNPDFRVVCEEL